MLHIYLKKQITKKDARVERGGNNVKETEVRRERDKEIKEIEKKKSHKGRAST